MADIAASSAVNRSHDKVSRLKPFAWMKRLASRKGSSSDRGRSPNKNPLSLSPSKSKRSPVKTNGPQASTKELQASAPSSGEPNSYGSQDGQLNGSSPALSRTGDEDHALMENKSIAPTLETNPGTIHSEGDHHSKAGTSNTAGGAMSSVSGGANSIFSSSNHSSHSLTTTLTTIQSAPSPHGPQQPSIGGSTLVQPGQSSTHQPQPSQSSSYFQHQFPTTPGTPASAIPLHLNPQAHLPTTYRSATANNLLTDNASVLTLASSSNRQVRRNSLDTNASIRAIAPSSVWGGSRESLPLSVLSHSTNEQPGIMSSATAHSPVGNAPQPPSTSSSATTATTTQQPSRPISSLSGLATAERGSGYSSGGVAAPALSSERNSIYASREKGAVDASSLKGAQGQDNSSVKSGGGGHGRSESITGSIGGQCSPLATPKGSITDGEKGL